MTGPEICGRPSLSERQSDLIIDDINFQFARCNYLVPDDDPVKFHKKYQLSIKALSKKYGFTGIDEYRVENRGDGRPGYIDVVWLNKNLDPVVAIEIDRRIRQKSIFKLKNIPADLKIWVYFGNKYVESPVPANIVIIERVRRFR